MKQNKNRSNLRSHVAILRIVFGLIWLIDASFKWRPAFNKNFLNQIISASSGQPNWLKGWFSFWIKLISLNPHLFSEIVMVSETMIALSLIFGFARRIIYLLAAVFSFLIWAIAEGFGGPYTASSTDVGTGIVYVIVFLSLYGLERFSSQPKLSIDNIISRRIEWWTKISSP